LTGFDFGGKAYVCHGMVGYMIGHPIAGAIPAKKKGAE